MQRPSTAPPCALGPVLPPSPRPPGGRAPSTAGRAGAEAAAGVKGLSPGCRRSGEDASGLGPLRHPWPQGFTAGAAPGALRGRSRRRERWGGGGFLNSAAGEFAGLRAAAAHWTPRSATAP